jgi:hypothetical protein
VPQLQTVPVAGATATIVAAARLDVSRSGSTAAAAVAAGQVWGLREPPVPRVTLPVRANVCSIKFNPAAAHLLAVGNAGHQV